MNKVMIVGNLTADPEMRSTGSGISVCSFRVAVERRFKDGEGNRVTDFIPVTCWRQLADLCGRYLAKGRKVGVVGTLQMRSYEDKQGVKRTAYEVVADEVEFLTPKGDAPYSGAGAAPGASSPSYDQDSSFPEATGFADMDDSSLPF